MAAHNSLLYLLVSIFLSKFLGKEQSFYPKIAALLLFLRIPLKRQVVFIKNSWLFDFGFYSAFDDKNIFLVAASFSPIKKLPSILALKWIVHSLSVKNLSLQLDCQISSWLFFFLYRHVENVGLTAWIKLIPFSVCALSIGAQARTSACTPKSLHTPTH